MNQAAFGTLSEQDQKRAVASLHAWLTGLGATTRLPAIILGMAYLEGWAAGRASRAEQGADQEAGAAVDADRAGRAV